MTTVDVKKMLSADARLTAETLVNLPWQNVAAKELAEAMKYSLLAGGKRIRPALVLETCRMFGGSDAAALPFAAAVEMIHTYSLIHDDLPCMDNDDLRRGRPTNHKVYGEATALLAGDALLTDAFRLVSENEYVSSDVRAGAVAVLSRAAGSFGMVSGQILDMSGETKQMSEAELIRLHNLKTGALIRASVQLGCLAAALSLTDDRAQDMIRYAEHIGLVFQIVDDVLDVTALQEELGKSIGKDLDEGKTTFLTFHTVSDAMREAERLTVEAIGKIEKYPHSEELISLAEYLLKRKN